MNSLLLAALLTTTPLEAPKPRQLPIVIVDLAFGLLASSFVHESGHALGIKVLDNAKLTEYTPYPTRCGSRYSNGCVEFIPSAGDSDRSRLIMQPMGMLATRVASEGWDLLGNRDFTGPKADQMLAALYLTSRLDSFQYVLRGAIKSWTGSPTDRSWDPQGVISSITKDRTKQNWMYIGTVALLALDLILDWDEVSTNWNRLWI